MSAEVKELAVELLKLGFNLVLLVTPIVLVTMLYRFLF